MTGTKITNWTVQDAAAVENAIRRGASRRDLLQMLLCGGVAMGPAAAILGRADRALADTPKSGGALRAATYSSSTADTLDPVKASMQVDYVRCCSFYNRLTFLDAEDKIQMELAESVESPDAKVWTIRLRKGVTFHNGKTLTAADVVYSLKRHLDPAVGSKAAVIAKQMSDFKIVDDRTVEVTLGQANADFPTILALHHFMIIADGTSTFAKANGTGAFLCETFEPGLRSVGLKNRNYWKSSGPYLDSFEFFAIADDVARVNALISGDIQIAAMINPRSLRLLETQPSVKLSTTNSGNYTDMIMRLDVPPGDKPGFVEGMNLLLNRELIRKSAFRGMAIVQNDQPIPPSSRYFNSAVKPRAFDPDRAKSLLTKAGVIGQTIPLVASEAATGSVDMATLLQQAAAKIGLTIDVQRQPSDGYWTNTWNKVPFHFGNNNPRPTPDLMFTLFYASNAPWNTSHYRSEKFDRLLLEARGLLDEAKRKDIYGEMQQMVSDEAGTGIPALISNTDALNKRVMGMKPNPLGGLMGYAFAEYVWLDG